MRIKGFTIDLDDEVEMKAAIDELLENLNLILKEKHKLDEEIIYYELRQLCSTNYENINLVYGLTHREIKCIKDGEIIQSIKYVIERTGLGLREAKDIVDAVRDTMEIRR